MKWWYALLTTLKSTKACFLALKLDVTTKTFSTISIN
jgi:hypothetical protein